MSAASEILPRPAEPPFFTRARLRAQRRVLAVRRQWSDEGDSGQGLVITDAEIDRILGRCDDAPPSTEERALGEAIAAADAFFDSDPRWERLRDALDLPQIECDLLSLAVAAEFDPWFRRVCGYLHDDATINGATPWLTAQIFGWLSAPALGPDSGLASWRLARPAEERLGPTTPWIADPQIAAWLIGTATATAGLEIPSSLATANEACIHRAALDDAVAFIEAIGTPIEIHLRGAAGSGRRTLAAQIAAAFERPLLVADVSDLRSAESAVDPIVRMARAARLTGAAICIAGCEELPPAAWRALRERADLLFVAAEAAPPRGSDAAQKTIIVGSLSRPARLALWERLTGAEAPPSVAQWSLTAGEVAAAARVRPAGDTAVAAACSRMLHHELPDLLTALPLPFGWSDIVLPEHVQRELRELEERIRFRAEVYDEWGFGPLVPLTRGITAMFAGPSGTGKTMAAQVVAREAGLPLYRVDLAGVVNKYIGETEKRLKRVFDACERADCILFFDEADALFGQRTQVRDAHDRFANIEIDYLLQRMEQFEGIAVLATNRKSDLDSAFLRRLRVVIDFLPPARAERLALWRRALPERAPSGQELLEAVAWEVLADRLAVTGAEIQAIALGAAFRACAERSRIGMRHIMAAARRELIKRGAVLRGEEWES